MINYNEIVGGGIASLMPGGGMTPGAFNFAQRSEPVLRMARGGIAHFDVGGFTNDTVGDPGGFWDELGVWRSNTPAAAPTPDYVTAPLTPAVVSGPTSSDLSSALTGANTFGATTPQPEVPTPPQAPNIDYGGYSAKDIQNLLDWQATQYNPYTGQNIGESLKAQGIDRYSPEQIKYAVDTLDRAKSNATLVALNQGYGPQGFISSSYDAKTGATMLPRPDGSTDVFFPDGTRQRVAPNVDAFSVLKSYKGPTTGDYGVNVTNLGPWSDPNWRTIEALKRAAQEKERVQTANTPSPFTAGPGPAATPQNLTLDPIYAQLIGSADPKAVLRAINAGTLKPGALPADIAAKLFPSGGTFPSETKTADALQVPDAQIDAFLKYRSKLTDPQTGRAIQDDPNDPALRKAAAEWIQGQTGRETAYQVTGGKQYIQDPKTGAIVVDKPDGGSYLYFPDGSKTSAPKGQDPYEFARAVYKGPSTGDYGVSLKYDPVTGLPSHAPNAVSSPDYLKKAASATAAPSGVASLAPAPAAPKSVATGIQALDYQGNKFDTGQTLNLAKQVAQAFDPKSSSGAAFGTKGQGIGFEYDQAKQILGKDPSAAEQVMLDISRYLQKEGVTDFSKIGSKQIEVEVPEGGEAGGSHMEKQTVFFDKDTGKQIGQPNGYVGQTYTGKGQTSYFLTEKPDGSIGVKTVGGDTSDAGTVAMLLPLLLGPAGLNLSGMLGGALQGAGLGQLASQMVSQGLISGGTNALFGGDFLKGALSGALGPAVSAGIGAAIPEGFRAENPGLTNFLTKAGTNVVGGLLTGQDPSKVLGSATLGGIMGVALDKAGIPSNLGPLLASLISSGKITPQAAMQLVSQVGKKG